MEMSFFDKLIAFSFSAIMAISFVAEIALFIYVIVS